MTINEVLSEVQQKLNAPKSQYNNFGKYSYRNCEDILEAVKPLLAPYKATVTVSDEIVLIGDRYYVEATATLIYGTEEKKCKASAREPEQRKGMDEAQVTGASSSYARKYALNGLFAIDDNKDPDNPVPPKNESLQADKKIIQEIEELAEKAGVKISKLEKKYNVKVISALDQNQAKECVNGLMKMIANG